MFRQEVTFNIFKKSQINEKVYPFLIVAISVFSFLGTANFIGKQGIFIGLSALLMIIYIIFKGKIVIDLKTIFACIFMAAYSAACFIFDREHFVTNLIYNAVIVIIIEFFECCERKKVTALAIALSYTFGLFVSFVLIVIRTYWTQGLVIYGDIVNNFWGGSAATRTGLPLLIALMFAINFTLICFKNRFRKWYTIPLFAAICLFSIFVPIYAGSRSTIVAVAVIIFVIISFKVLKDKNNKVLDICYFIGTFLVAAAIVYVCLYKLGIVDVPESFLKIKILARIFEKNSDDSRLNLYYEFFENFYKYPLGGLTNHMSNHYVHNIFLDFYTFGGAIPFLIFMTFVVFLVKDSYIFLSRGKQPIFEKALILSLIVAMPAAGLLEPVYQANPNCIVPMFLMWLYISNEIKTHKEDYKKIKKEKKNKKKEAQA